MTQTQIKYCPNCGQTLAAYMPHCGRCGVVQPNMQPIQQPIVINVPSPFMQARDVPWWVWTMVAAVIFISSFAAVAADISSTKQMDRAQEQARDAQEQLRRLYAH